MGKQFSTCLLVQENMAAPELVVTEVSLRPGQSFSPEQGKAVLLAGGFASLLPGSGFPLSPTLQLNNDRAVCSTEQLSQLAVAELERINDINYRSYAIEADSRVCIVGDDIGAINAFIDSYGGVLEIEPLLLKGHDAEIATAIELSVSNSGEKLHLEYQLRQPIRTELCTYCGSCGPACPEKSISAKLYLDFDSCTLCKECEKVCAEGAIDMHRLESRAMDIPALIVLDGVELELPEGSRLIYAEKDIGEYFATLFPCQIDEVVTCDNSICQYSGRLEAGCSLCLTSCRFGAVSQGEAGVVVDALKCEECGECVAVCPTGALQNRRFDDTAFVKYFKDISLSPDTTVVVGAESSLHELWWQSMGERYERVFFFEYSQINGLSLFHFMSLLSTGVAKVVVLCEKSGGTELSRQVSLANSLITSLYNATGRVVLSGVGDVEAHMSAESQRQALLPGTAFPGYENRRQGLSAALQTLVIGSGKIADVQPAGFISFATLTCDTDRCTHCMACLNECSIEALGADQENLTLNHLGSMCVACALCVHVCPEDALQLSPRFKLNAQFFKPKEMARAEAIACKTCGKVFGTRKSFERVMAILSQKESVDTSHFEHCDTCRVAKLF